MDQGDWIALLSVTAAIVVAFWQLRRQAKQAVDANQISVVTGLLGEFRSDEMQQHLRELEKPFRGYPRAGFAGLGEAASSAYAICYLFEYVGQLVALRSIPDDLVLSLMSTHLLRTWETLEPYIIGERERRDRTLPPGVSRRFLPHFEHLVGLVLERRGPDGSVPIKGINLRRLNRPLSERLSADGWQ